MVVLSEAFLINLAILVGTYAIAILGLNIIMGYAGLPWLGQASLVGVGGYVTALLVVNYHAPFWLVVPASVALATGAGVGVGLPALRLNEDFLAVATIGFNFAIQAFFNYTPYFGGFAGISGIPYTNSPDIFLAVVTIILIALVLLSKVLSDSWIGLAWVSIRENEVTSQAAGIRVGYYKMLAIAIGSAFAGFSGSLQIYYLTSIQPNFLGFDQSIIMVVAVVVGGLGTIIGPIFGAILITLLPDIFQFVSNYRLLIFGILIVVLVLFERNGVFGNESHLRKAMQHLRVKSSIGNQAK